MKKKIFFIVASLMLLFGLATSLTGCNFMAKHLGGTMEVQLEENQKLVNCTWKDDNFWYLTKPMSDSDVAETYTFSSDTNFGVFEGKVIITEVKSEE